jgi:branched-chain amino acid transport system ATP-binding protein
MVEPVLSTRGLGRRFGGLEAVKDVSLELRHGAIHALVGPNGAGKTTFINVLSGDLPATAGRILFRGRDVTRLSPDRRARLGVGRSYQRTSVFPSLSAHENCRLAAQARVLGGMRRLATAYGIRSLREKADAALEAAGLSGRGRRLASALSHGEQRQLEVAMVLATDPEVLLLDEPLAGMGADEARRMVELLRGLRPDHATLLVEHDMDAVFALADAITVMANGQVIASGPPAEIRASPAVRQAYLGGDGAREEEVEEEELP